MQLFKKIITLILTIESKLILRKYRPFVIAVTGSVGKTSTKDAIYSVMKQGPGFVRKSDKSMNSDIGLPLTIIGVPNAWHSFSGWISNIRRGLSLICFRQEYPDYLIVEVGADHPGDISRVAQWLRPDVAVITKVSDTPVHVEFFPSPQAVFKEKASLAKAVKKGGALVLYADDPKVAGLASLGPELNIKIVTFGLTSGSDVKGSQVKVKYAHGPVGFSFVLELNGESSKVEVRDILGEIYIQPFLAAAAVGSVRGMLQSDIIHGLNEYDAPKGRMRIIQGNKDSTIIDDTYNSSPDAVVAALETIRGLESNKDTGTDHIHKIVILGDMMELGKYSTEEHRKIGALVSDIASELITVGPRSKLIADEAIHKGMHKNKVHVFDTATEAAGFVVSIVKQGDIVLVKGSQSIRLERVVKALMKDPDRAGEVLVRQEKEWLEKV